MKLSDFPLLADENVSREVGAFLHHVDFDVRNVIDCGLAGCSDVRLLQFALGQGRVVLTHDADFGTLAMRSGEPLVGVVYLRPGHLDPQFTIGTLKAILREDPDLNPPFVMVARRRTDRITMRIRQVNA